MPSVLVATVEPSGALTVTVLLEMVDDESRAESRVPTDPSNASSTSSPPPDVTVTAGPFTVIGAGDVPVTLLWSLPPVAVAVAVAAIVVVPAADGVKLPV